jgi:hypothetical protein
MDKVRVSSGQDRHKSDLHWEKTDLDLNKPGKFVRLWNITAGPKPMVNCTCNVIAIVVYSRGAPWPIMVH